jgi:hypothetical protein
MWAVLCLAALACLLGLLDRPSAGPHPGYGAQALDLIRVLATAGLAVALVLGPGIALRAALPRWRRAGLGFLFLPGFLVLAGVGALAWALAGSVAPDETSYAILIPLLGLLAGCLLGAGPAALLDRDERRCLLVAGCVLGYAVARALWSLGPEGELYGGTISRTLEVGDRSDSRISFHLVQLVAQGQGPYSELATSFYSPYNFSSRGPLSGLASAPIVLASGGRPPATLPEQPWQPFDAEGFMAYRLAMMTFACSAFVSLWDLVRRLAGSRAAWLGLLLAATTPFLVHEVWFTWPKMLAASCVLLAAICVVDGRLIRAGLLAGLGYLMHPVAMLSLPALALLALWPLRGAVPLRPQVKRLAALAVGPAIALLSWRWLNGSHYTQSGFVEYFKEAGSNLHPDPGAWLKYRAESVGNTLVPLLVILIAAGSLSLNVVGGTSPPVIHFFFQYWNGLPFGVAIIFFPLLLISLYRAGRRWPWPVFATVIVPFLVFAAYWGSSSSGMLREGLQAWILTLVVVVACQQAAEGFPWLRSGPIRAILALRTVELLAIVLVPTLATGRHVLIAPGRPLTDTVALLGMIATAALLATLIWRSGGSAAAAPAPGSQRPEAG